MTTPLLALLACATPTPVEPAPASAPSWTRPVDHFDVMGTVIDVQLPEAEGAADAVAAVREVFAEVEVTANEWRPGTPLAEINAHAGTPTPAPEPLRTLLRRSLDIAGTTDGAFDPTWAAVWDQWDFRSEPHVLPDAAVLAERVKLIDWTRVVIDDEAGTVLLPEAGMKLGLGGIAKGWALDRSAAELRRRGFTDFVISAGGQVMAGGRKGDHAWRVGVRDPRGQRDDSFAMIEVTDASVSTSGDYEHTFELDGVRYHHILDPDTGWPARGVRSATVICPDATLADALSTAIIVQGVERGLALAERLPDVEAVLVDASGTVHATSGVGERLVTLHAPLP